MDSLAAAGGIVVWMASERCLLRCENVPVARIMSRKNLFFSKHSGSMLQDNAFLAW